MCQRMANEGEAERLLKHDDISTTLIVDILMEFKRLKLSGLDLPPIQPEEKETIKGILGRVKTSQDFGWAVGELLNCDWAKEVTAKMGKEEKTELENHLKMYLNGLTTGREFALEKTDRYEMEGKKGAKVMVKKEVSKGKKILTLLGRTAEINKEQEESLGNRGVDTSCILKSPKCVLILNGPVCFVNHDCNPNAKFAWLPNNKEMCFETKRKIKPGEELTIDYGANYFGRSNKNCECQTCETEKKGAFRKLKRGERRDLDLYIPEEEKKMVQVNVLCFYQLFQ